MSFLALYGIQEAASSILASPHTIPHTRVVKEEPFWHLLLLSFHQSIDTDHVR